MHCYQEAAQYFQVPALVLRAIHRVEGGRRGDRVADANGTFDHGFMQINTCWKPLLHQQGWSMRFVTQHDCANIFAAAWILRQHMNKTNQNVWLSVADYHSANPAYGYPYAEKVFEQAVQIEKHQGDKVNIENDAFKAPKAQRVIYHRAKTINFAPQNTRFNP